MLFGKNVPVGLYMTNAKYELPSTVKSLQEGWLSTFEGAVVAAALFGGIESQLLGFVKSEISGEQWHGSSGSGNALLTLTYLALFFSISATMDSLILIDELATVTIRAARIVTTPTGRDDLGHEEYDESIRPFLTRFNGGRKAWQWVLWHWLFTSIAGFVCVVAQLVLYIWCTEVTGLKVLALLVGIFSIAPLLFLLPFSTRSSQNDSEYGTGEQGNGVGQGAINANTAHP